MTLQLYLFRSPKVRTSIDGAAEIQSRGFCLSVIVSRATLRSFVSSDRIPLLAFGVSRGIFPSEPFNRSIRLGPINVDAAINPHLCEKLSLRKKVGRKKADAVAN